MIPIGGAADEEVHKIIDDLKTEIPLRPKGNTESQGAITLSGTSSLKKNIQQRPFKA